MFQWSKIINFIDLRVHVQIKAKTIMVVIEWAGIDTHVHVHVCVCNYYNLYFNSIPLFARLF